MEGSLFCVVVVYENRHKAGLTSNVIANMGKGESVQLEVLRKICQELNCGIEDIVEIVPDTDAAEKVR